MTTKKRLAVVTGTYTKDGQEKNNFTSVGSLIIKDDGGMFIELLPFMNYTSLPRKDGKLYVSVFDDEKKSDTQDAAKPKEAKAAAPFDDEIPF